MSIPKRTTLAVVLLLATTLTTFFTCQDHNADPTNPGNSTTGPGQDWKFPTTKVGLPVGALGSAKQALVLNATKLYVNDLDANLVAAVLAKYSSELANTYISYSGSTSVTAQNDYIRMDGPNVWIEFSYQGGVIIQGTPHPHAVWRDRTTDYGGTK